MVLVNCKNLNFILVKTVNQQIVIDVNKLDCESICSSSLKLLNFRLLHRRIGIKRANLTRPYYEVERGSNNIVQQTVISNTRDRSIQYFDIYCVVSRLCWNILRPVKTIIVVS